jgi:acetyl-CoA carboxylase biotin carboxyl carrier protein
MAGKADKEEKPVASAEGAELQKLYALMQAENLEELEIKEGDRHIRLSRKKAEPVYASAPRTVVHAAPRAAAPVAASEPVSDKENIASPLAGVFYRAASPTSAPFVKEGDTVDAGHTLCLVEAMKVMNEIKAEKRCKIVKIVAENSRPVTAGQPLFWIE